MVVGCGSESKRFRAHATTLTSRVTFPLPPHHTEPKVGKTSLVKALLNVDPADETDERNQVLVVSRTGTSREPTAPVRLPGHAHATVRELSSRHQVRAVDEVADVGIYVANANSPPLDRDVDLLRMLSYRCRMVKVALTHAGTVGPRSREVLRDEWQRTLGLTEPPFLVEITGYDNADRVTPEPWRTEGVAELREAILATLHQEGAEWLAQRRLTANDRPVAMLIADALRVMVMPAVLKDEAQLEEVRVRAVEDLFRIYFPGVPVVQMPVYLQAAAALDTTAAGVDDDRADGAESARRSQGLSRVASLATRPGTLGGALAVARSLVTAVNVVDSYLWQPAGLLWRELERLVTFAVVCKNPDNSRADSEAVLRRLRGESMLETAGLLRCLTMAIASGDASDLQDRIVNVLALVPPAVVAHSHK